MDAVEHPIDWWAYGGHEAVMRELKCSRSVARRKVRAAIRAYYDRTGDPLWRPMGHRGYADLRRAIMAGRVLDNELV